jgi:hypothetical protein
MTSPPSFTREGLREGDWIKYRSGYYGGGRLAEIHAIASDARYGDYVVTTEGNVMLDRILEVRRLPTNVVVLNPTRMP